MTEAEKAYKAAEREIARAVRDGDETLDLSEAEYRALEVIPPITSQNVMVDKLEQFTDPSDQRKAEIAAKITKVPAGDMLPPVQTRTIQVKNEIAPRFDIIHLSNTQITDLSPIAGLTGIKSLYLISTQVSDLSPIAGMTMIKVLNFVNTQVTDLSPIAGMTEIKVLDLSGTQITDLSPIAGMTRIRELDLSGTLVTDLRPLVGMNELETLECRFTQVSDLTPLRQLNHLKNLDLEGSLVSSLTELPTEAEFYLLDLSSSQASDIRPLLGLKLPDERGSHQLKVTNTPAAQADPRIAEIDAMEDDEARVAALLDYLKNLDHPGDAADDPHVFISYARADLDLIQPFHTFLYAEGHTLWWDQNISGGERWRERVAAQLNAARTVVTFWTANSTQSDAVREEASTAQSSGRLIHVRLDDSPLPFGFAETQYIDLRDWDGTATHPGMRKLLQALADKASPPDNDTMAARLRAASPVDMSPQGGVLAPVDTPALTPPPVISPAQLQSRLDGMRQTLVNLQAKATDTDNYQFPPDLGHALDGFHTTLHREVVNWFALEDAKLSLSDCMDDHRADDAWNKTAVRDLRRLMVRVEELRPYLQPEQVPLDQPDAKPPEPEPQVTEADRDEITAVAADLAVATQSDEALQVLSQEARAYITGYIDRIKRAGDIYEPTQRFRLLRKGIKGMAFATGAIIATIGSGIAVNLLTAPGAATTLMQRLTPIFDRLVQFFL